MNSAVKSDRRAGILLMLAAGLCWSLGGIIVRSLTVRDVWEIVFWRSLFMGVFVALLLAALRGRAAFGRLRAIGWPGLISAACLAGQIYCFIIALSLTSTANTFLLMSVSPLITALVGRAFMGEHLRWFTWVAIAAALAGIGIMFGSGAALKPAAPPCSATCSPWACPASTPARFCSRARCAATARDRPT